MLGGTATQQSTFYSFLYKNLQSPTTFSEAGGYYRCATHPIAPYRRFILLSEGSQGSVMCAFLGVRASVRWPTHVCCFCASLVATLSYFDSGLDGNVHSLANGTERYFTDLSLWDIFRTQLPLLGFWQPTIMRDVARTLVSMYEQFGGIVCWPFAYEDAGVMSGRCAFFRARTRLLIQKCTHTTHAHLRT